MKMTSLGTRQAHIGWWCVGLLLVATVLVVWRQPPEVMTDAGTCLLAAEQYHQQRLRIVELQARGDEMTIKQKKELLELQESLEFHTLLEANPVDLQKQIATKITWWPASYSSLPYLLRQGGLNWGQSLQLVFLIGWGLGVWGWSRFFRRLVSPAILPWLLAAFLTFRYTHANANVYDAGEFLFWSLFPWVLLINLQAMQPGKIDSWQEALTVALAAILTTLLVTVKYSAGLSALGIAVAWVVVVVRYQVPLSRLYFWSGGAAVGTLLVILGGLLPSGNPSNIHGEIQWTAICWIPGAWTFAITDLESLVARLFIQDRQTSWLPAIGRFGDGQVAWLTPLTLGLLLTLWYQLRREPQAKKEHSVWNPTLSLSRRRLIRAVVVIHLVTYSLVLGGLIFAGSAIHMDARFLRPAAIALLPWLLVGIVHSLRSSNYRARLAGIVTLGIFLVIPAMYGTATATYKTVIRGSAASARTGPLGIRHDLLGEDGDAKHFYKELQALQTGPTTTYYLLEHGLALPLAKQRVLIEHAHLRSLEHLATKRYQEHPEGGVILVIPDYFEEKEGNQASKLTVIKKSFVDVPAKQWERRRMKSQPKWLVLIARR